MAEIRIWRAGGKFSDQFSRHAEYVGRFEIGEYDGRPDVSWAWGFFARQDRPAQRWVYNESVRLQERVTR